MTLEKFLRSVVVFSAASTVWLSCSGTREDDELTMQQFFRNEKTLEHLQTIPCAVRISVSVARFGRPGKAERQEQEGVLRRQYRLLKEYQSSHPWTLEMGDGQEETVDRSPECEDEDGDDEKCADEDGQERVEETVDRSPECEDEDGDDEKCADEFVKRYLCDYLLDELSYEKVAEAIIDASKKSKREESRGNTECAKLMAHVKSTLESLKEDSMICETAMDHVENALAKVKQDWPDERL